MSGRPHENPQCGCAVCAEWEKEHPWRDSVWRSLAKVFIVRHGLGKLTVEWKKEEKS